MFEKYNEEARRTIFFARNEALRSGSASIEPEHLLMGLLAEDRTQANQLFNLAPHREDFRKQLGLPVQNSGKALSGDIPLSNTGKYVLAYAAEEAERLYQATGPATGYPLKLKTTSKQEITQPDKTLQTYTGVIEMEVVEFSQSPLNPALFEAPPGFKKVDKIVDPTQKRVTYWEWFKEKLHEWFG